MNVANRSAKIKLVSLFILVFFSSLFLVNCTEDSEDFLLGEEYIESQTDITLIDTFGVKLSTVLFDTVQTSNTAKILLGDYKDDVFGEMHSNSYLQIGVPDTFYVLEEDVYDSLTFVLTYNNYYFGDTTKSQTISVHQLTESIEYNNDDVDYISADRSFSYDPEPLGTITYTPRPNRVDHDSVIVRLDDELGQELFDMLYNISDYVANDDIFARHFFGLALIADDSDGSIIGFNASEGEAALVLHTTRWGTSTAKVEYVFGLSDESKQFNNITYNFQSTPLEGLEDQEHQLPSAESNNLAYIQGGVGLTIRIDFPTLENILLEERGTVMKAQLVLAPASTNVYDYDLPSDLSLYQVNVLNKLTSSAITSSVLSLDDLYNENTYYTFDLTSYIKAQIDNNYIDPDYGLLITVPSSAFTGSFERLLIDSQNENTQLKIYYMTY